MAEFKEIQIGENGQVYEVKDETARQNAGSGDGTVTGVKVGSTTYPPNGEGVVDISPAIPDVSGKANKSEMSVVPGTGANADKTTITLKEGTNATVLTQHQDISGKVDKDPNKELIPSTDLAKLQNLPTADQLTQQIGQKANDNAVVKTVTINGETKQPQNGNVSFNVQAGGETVVINSDGANIVDSHTNPSILVASSARQMYMAAQNIETLFRKVNDLYDKLAGIAFTNGKPANWKEYVDWSSVTIPTHTITLGTMTNVSASLDGTAISGSTSATEGEVTILLAPTSNNYIGSISVKDASNNDVAFTQTDVVGGTEITFILSGNVTISASASSGIEVNVSGTGITSYTTGVQPNTAAQLTIALPEHHTWGTVTVSYGGTDITSQCTISQANNADKVITLPNNLSDMSKSISIVANTVEDAHVTIAISGSNFVVKQGNTQLSNGSKVYNGSAAQTLTIEPASGYKFSTLPSADKGTMTNNGYYEASSLEIGTSVEGTLTITAAGSLLNQNCQITLPSTGNGIASAALTDMNGTTITSPVVEGTGIKIVLTPDTDFTISSISIANMTEGTDYNVTDNNGVKTITIQHVTGNVVVTAAATQPTELRLNLKWFEEPATQPTITEGQPFSLTLAPLFNNGTFRFIAAATQDAGTENEKSIRAAVQVIMGGVDISAQSGVVTFDETNNNVTIEIAEPLGMVTINATARLRITRNRFWNQVGGKGSSTNACACESMIPFPQSVAGKVKYLYYGAGYSMAATNVALFFKQDLSSNTYWSTQGVYKKIDTLISGTDYSPYFVYMKPTIGLVAAEGGVISQETDSNNPIYPYLSAQRKAETGESYNDIPIVPVVTREDFNNSLFEDPTD